MFISSWSGGKDSCFAFYKAMSAGFKVSHLLNFISKEYQRVSFHGVRRELIQAQAELAGIPLVQKETTPGNYETEFKEAVRSLLPGGIRGMIFGDIYLDEHRQWVERVCRELGCEAVEPLWGRDTGDLMKDYVDAGVQAVIVSAQSDLIDKEWIGKPVDMRFIEHLKSKPDVDPCGEKGEYHTLVLGCPVFKGRIEITEEEVVKREGYWFLDIKDYRVVT
ncbi:MAG TPA: diphthine--ammonia ligase [Thermodesulfovibrionales bacterium]|nr:diphthine--ammonia ligase [Thermodesulfovibrionales bacterium]